MEIKPIEISSVEQKSAQAVLFRNVYTWMTMALVVTGITSLIVANSPSLMQAIYGNRILFYGLLLGELGLVWYISARIGSLSLNTATLLFIVYSIFNGVTMAFLFAVYTATSIASTFFITAGTFAAMALVGTFTKKDLSSWGRFLIMALIGLIIASVVNLFLKNETMYWIISYIGVLLFVALTAYDAQKIKNLIQMHGNEVNESTQKIALMGALTLYLDFINLFIYLLRIMGNRR
ncbi:MAG: Bax inhibitor-1/YccA family protein [Dysgonamonadaceae bacterium]